MRKNVTAFARLLYSLMVLITPSFFLWFPDLVFALCILSLLILLEYFFLAVLIRSFKWNLVIIFFSWLLVLLIDSIDRYLYFQNWQKVCYEFISDYTLLQMAALLSVHLLIQAGLVFIVRQGKTRENEGIETSS